MDYSFFDGLIDAVFVIDDGRGVLYCNDSAAKLCDTSVKRLARGKPIYDIIEFSDPGLFVTPNGTEGQSEPQSYKEITFKLKSGKEGKVQIAIQPFQDSQANNRWAIMVRDVTLEEVLHAKYHKQLQEKEVFIEQLKVAQSQLEAYSKNLEQMVEDRTQQVKRANKMLSAIMNSLGQGFLVFDKGGFCSEVYTRACETILEGVPAHQNIADVFKVKADERATFEMWLKGLFEEALPFESMKELGPAYYAHSQNRHIVLDYFALRNEAHKIENIVVVATDQTSEFEANRALEKEKKYAQMVVKLITGKRQFRQFLNSTSDTIAGVQRELINTGQPLDIEHIFRVLHTLEGEAGIYSAGDIWSAAREAQEAIEPFKKGQKSESPQLRQELMAKIETLRRSYENFLVANDELFAMVGIGQGDKIEVSISEIERILINLRTKGLAPVFCDELANQLLREPVIEALRHYQDVVTQVAQRLGKKVAPLKFHGEKVKVFLNNYSDLFSSFVHVFRNVVDHGIEPSEEREMMGKDPQGQIEVFVSETIISAKKWIRVEVVDDGQGLSLEKLRNKVSATLSADELNVLSDFDLAQKVFDSGVSTKEAIGEFSGRGIGLNAVKAEAERLGGKAWIESTPGKGAKITVEIPDLQRVARQSIAA